MEFQLFPLRFEFTALDSIHFPPGKSANIVRGAFGSIFRRIACVPGCTGARACEFRNSCAYARIFEPASAGDSPSGFSDWPRPFVFRSRHLDGATIPPGQPFAFDVHIFDLAHPAIACFVLTFAQLVRAGIGPRRGRAELLAVRMLDRAGAPASLLYENGKSLLSETPPPIALDLDPKPHPVSRIRVEFLSPTELKSGQKVAERPDFATLFNRVRDRIGTLSALYGRGPLELDFKGMGDRAARVKMIRCDIRPVLAERRSSRTGQTHPIGGFIGASEYECEDAGSLAEFLPFLEAARWTGVGRQTVWGKGEIAVHPSLAGPRPPFANCSTPKGTDHSVPFPPAKRTPRGQTKLSRSEAERTVLSVPHPQRSLYHG